MEKEGLALATGKQPGRVCALSVFLQLSAGEQSVNNVFNKLLLFFFFKVHYFTDKEQA